MYPNDHFEISTHFEFAFHDHKTNQSAS